MNNQETLKDEQKMKKAMKYIYELAKEKNMGYMSIWFFPYELECVKIIYQFNDDDIIHESIANLDEEE